MFPENFNSLTKKIDHFATKNCFSQFSQCLQHCLRFINMSKNNYTACISTMSGDFHATKSFNLKYHKVNFPVVINCRGYFTSTNPVSIS